MKKLKSNKIMCSGIKINSKCMRDSDVAGFLKRADDLGKAKYSNI